MCYMAEREHPDRVGVRELRQNLSVYLQRVKEGETLEVTERGLPVAELRPRSPAPLSKIDQMIADGRITPARSRPAGPAAASASDGSDGPDALRDPPADA